VLVCSAGVIIMHPGLVRNNPPGRVGIIVVDDFLLVRLPFRTHWYSDGSARIVWDFAIFFMITGYSFSSTKCDLVIHEFRYYKVFISHFFYSFGLQIIFFRSFFILYLSNIFICTRCLLRQLPINSQQKSYHKPIS